MTKLAQHSSASAEWGTPPEWAARVRHVLGTIDLDPASTPEANAVVQARRIYTEKENGLLQVNRWRGRVFLNPPGGRGLPQKFFAKLLSSYRDGSVTAAVYLGYSLEQLLWIKRRFYLPAGAMVAVPQSRIKFLGAGKSPTHGNFFALFPDSEARLMRQQFVLAFSEDCLILRA